MTALIINHENIKNLEVRLPLDYTKLRDAVKPEFVKAIDKLIKNIKFDDISLIHDITTKNRDMIISTF